MNATIESFHLLTDLTSPMSNPLPPRRDDELNLNDETLEQWEQELNDFTAEIIERLSEIAQQYPADAPGTSAQRQPNQ